MQLSRRSLVLLFLSAAGLPRVVAAAVRTRVRTGPHPTPRPGITSAKVASKEQLADTPRAIAVFDLVREIPEVIDGIRCQCGCADIKGYYSLLSCFEMPDKMAIGCEICQGQARLAHRLHKSGSNLEEVRRGIEARFG